MVDNVIVEVLTLDHYLGAAAFKDRNHSSQGNLTVEWVNCYKYLGK